MYIKTIEYTDYNGNPRKEDFYFNLSPAEITEMQFSKDGGFAEYITRIANAQKTPEIIKLFKDLILMSYGEKAPDGRGFIKVDSMTGRKLCDDFVQSAAYSVLFMELISDPDRAAEFINNIVPADAAEAIEKAKADGTYDQVKSKIYALDEKK